MKKTKITFGEIIRYSTGKPKAVEVIANGKSHAGWLYYLAKADAVCTGKAYWGYTGNKRGTRYPSLAAAKRDAIKLEAN